MKLSKYFNELLIDQLPILSEMRRLVETLAFSAPASGTESRSVVIEQIPELRNNILQNDFEAIASQFKSKMQNESPEDQKAEMTELAAMYDMLNVEDFMEDPKCAVCGEPAEKRCSKCKMEWYCGRKCQVAAWKKHKPFCEMISGLSVPYKACQCVQSLKQYRVSR